MRQWRGRSRLLLVVVGFIGGAVVAAPAAGQIGYVSRFSRVAYFEFEQTLSGVQLDEADGVAVGDLSDFNQFVVFPSGGTPFTDTSAGQFSRLFSNAIELDLRAKADERFPSNIGFHEAGAISDIEVVFELLDPIDFTLTGEFTDAATGSDPNDTVLFLTGPNTNLSLSSGVIDESGTLEPGQYTFSAKAESYGRVDDDFFGTTRTNGQDLSLSALLLLTSGGDIDGDYNDDGAVDQGDLDLALLNWGDDVSVTGVPAGWVNQPPAGLIGQTQLDGVLLNWGDTAESSVSAVPEPACLGTLGLLSVALAHRRAAL